MTREDLIADTKSGLLVAEVLGMHMVDPVSGAFSVGVSGLSIEKGRVCGPVKGAMISGSLLDLLSRIDGVASDLTFQGSLGSPPSASPPSTSPEASGLTPLSPVGAHEAFVVGLIGAADEVDEAAQRFSWSPVRLKAIA